MRALVVQLLSHQSGRSFLLPVNGETIDKKTQTAMTIETCRLPFDRCLLEYEIEPSFYYKGSELAVPEGMEVEYPSASILIVQCFEDIGVHCTVVSRVCHQGVTMWLPCRGSFGLTRDSNAITIDANGCVSGSITILGPPSLPAHLLQPASEYAHELQVLAHFVMLCNCDNVKPVKAFSPSPAFIRYSKERRRRPPDEYWILDCFLGEHQERTRGQAAGSHTSPRFHVRRGHVRRLPDGRTTWVKQCTVGDARIGKIDKDYRIRASAQPGGQV
jgi:hypothetical protein